MRNLVFLILLSFGNLSYSALISTTVGQVQNHIVTSREVTIHYFIENAIFAKPSEIKNLSIPAIESRAFAGQVNNLLLERVVFLESQNFAVAKVSDKEVSEAVSTIDSRLNAKPVWKQIEASNQEIKNTAEQMLQAKKFIKFKADSSAVPVTDAEAEQYFKDNHLRFGTLPFSNFKDNIKAFLTRTQSEKRLKEWFEVLQNKYKVRNFQAEI